MGEFTSIAAGPSTARVPAADTDAEACRRDAVRADAVSYLTKTGNADLLAVLGLGDSHTPGCEWCSAPILRHSGNPGIQRFCSRKCSSSWRSAAAAAKRARRHG